MSVDKEEITHLNDFLTKLFDVGLPRPPGKENWVYRDLPKMREDFFDKFVELVGSENIAWITQAKYEYEDGIYKRGQLFISPEGIERLKARNKDNT